MNESSPAPALPEERVTERYQVAIDTEMRQLGEANHAIRIVNISWRGFSAESNHLFDAPSVVCVALPGMGEVKARVIWSDPRRVGAEFLALLTQDELTRAFGG